MIKDIIKRSKKATDWGNRDGFWKWVGTKIFDDDYLIKILDFFINSSTNRIDQFIKSSTGLDVTYKSSLIDEIISLRDRVLEELNQKKIEEDILIEKNKAKTEEEIRKWQERKWKFESEKLRWAELCKKYKIVKDEIYKQLLLNE